MTQPDITIVTLMSGRWQCLEAFLWSLEQIDYDKSKISLVWVTNTKDQIFLDMLNHMAPKYEKMYKELSITYVPIDLSSRSMMESGTGHVEHAEIIASLYNAAYKEVEDEFVLFLEDDVIAPSHCINRLLTHFQDDNIALAGSAVLDRHREQSVMAWKMKKVKVPNTNGSSSLEFIPQAVEKLWGVQGVDAISQSCTMARKSILDRLPKPVFQPKCPLSTTAAGADLVMSMHAKYMGYDIILDCDVRCGHMNSNGTVI